MCGDDQRPDHDVDAHSIARDEGKCTLLHTLMGNFVVVYEEEDILYEMMWRDGKGEIGLDDGAEREGARARGTRAEEERGRGTLDARDGGEPGVACLVFVSLFHSVRCRGHGCLDERGRRGAAFVFFSAARRDETEAEAVKSSGVEAVTFLA